MKKVRIGIIGAGSNDVLREIHKIASNNTSVCMCPPMTSTELQECQEPKRIKHTFSGTIKGIDFATMSQLEKLSEQFKALNNYGESLTDRLSAIQDLKEALSKIKDPKEHFKKPKEFPKPKSKYHK